MSQETPAPLETVSIKRYPNRRFYAKNTSKYVSLTEIEALVQEGHTVEIKDSQSGVDITRSVLTQLIMDRHPEKLSLFPSDMLHFMVRSNDMMSGFLRDYFRQSLSYLEYLQRQGATTRGLTSPMHWVQAWIDGFKATSENQPEPPSREEELTGRIEQLESRIRQLESQAE